MTFDDLVDIVNPLQHLPVVGTLYRAITGDHIKTFPKIAGDTLYGGWMGFAGSLADTMFEKITGKNFGDTVLSEVEDIFSPSSAAPTAVAANTPSSPDLGDRIVSAVENMFSSGPDTSAVATATPSAAAPAAAPAQPVAVAAATPSSPDLGDRIVSAIENLFSSGPDTAAVAAATPAAAAPAAAPASASLSAVTVPGQDALLNALSTKGIASDTAARAADAYRRSLGILPATGAPLSLSPSLH